MKWLALIFAGLLCGVAINGVRTAVFAQEHNSLVAEVQQLKNTRDQLNADWTQLLLEQKTLANDHMVEQAIANGLNLHVPEAKQVVYLQ